MDRPLPPSRIAAIDLLKGAAILAVFTIHADALPGHPLMVHLLNHAVPVFVVLFGLNAELWWRTHPDAGAATWWRGRAARLLPPVWAAMACWWAVALCVQMPGVTLHWWLPLVNAVGVLPNVGTGWFVTLLLQLVVVQPWLHALGARAGRRPLLAAGLACLAGGVALRPALVGWMGLWGARSVAPRLLGHVAFGMVLAHRRLPPGAGAVAAGVVAALACAASAGGLLLPAAGPYAERLQDLPMTVALLGAMAVVARVSPVAAVLSWCGAHSWGLYLGQMVVHDAAVALLQPERPSAWFGRATYAGVLLAGAVALVLLGNVVRAAWDARAAGARRAA